MFLNPNIRNKLILKQSYHNDMKNNQFAPDIIDDTIYLQEDDQKEIEYKNIIIVGEKATKDLEVNDNIEILLPKKTTNKISSEVDDLEDNDSKDNDSKDEDSKDDDSKDDSKDDKEDIEDTEDIEDKEDKEDTEDDSKDLFGGNKSNIKKIVVHSFF